MHKMTAPKLPRWLERMLPFERDCAEIDGQQLHVMEQGKGWPLLLLHGDPIWTP